MKPLLYDICCGAGGTTKGYQKAGFRVIGIDNKPQPHYCGDGFYRMDCLEFLDRYLAEEFERADAFHASPPCQDRTRACQQWRKRGYVYPKLIPQIRERLIKTGKPYIIENVPDAADLLINPVLLCGSMFNLRTYRHRLFETSFEMPLILDFSHGLKQNNLRGTSAERKLKPMQTVVGHCGYPGESALRKQAMGIDWMTDYELTQSIPWVYTELLGKHLMQHLEANK